MSSLNNQFCLFPIMSTFIHFSCLTPMARTSSTMLNKSHNTWLPKIGVFQRPSCTESHANILGLIPLLVSMLPKEETAKFCCPRWQLASPRWTCREPRRWLHRAGLPSEEEETVSRATSFSLWTRNIPLTISPLSLPPWIKSSPHKQPCLLSIFSHFNYLERWGNTSATRWAQRGPRWKNDQSPRGPNLHWY